MCAHAQGSKSARARVHGVWRTSSESSELDDAADRPCAVPSPLSRCFCRTPSTRSEYSDGDGERAFPLPRLTARGSSSLALAVGPIICDLVVGGEHGRIILLRLVLFSPPIVVGASVVGALVSCLLRACSVAAHASWPDTLGCAEAARDMSSSESYSTSSDSLPSCSCSERRDTDDPSCDRRRYSTEASQL